MRWRSRTRPPSWVGRAPRTCSSTADWSGGGPRSLRFYRPPGLNLETTARELYGLLWALAERVDRRHASRSTASCSPRSSTPRRSTWSTACSPRRSARWVCRWAASGSPTSSSRAGRAAQLPEIAMRAADRLCALVFGLADYSADLGLPSIANEHPIADWARAEIVNVAGAVGVPAIDGMTLDYPVADPALDAAAQPAPLPGADGAGLSRCGPGARLRDAGQVGRPPGAAVRGAAGIRGRHAARGARGGGGQAGGVRRGGQPGRQGRHHHRRRDVRPGHGPARPGGAPPGDGARPVRCRSGPSRWASSTRPSWTMSGSTARQEPDA